MNQPVLGVIGRDGKNPIRELSQRFTVWSIDEIYLGGDANGKYVPKVNDLVVDIINRRQYRVADVSNVAIPLLKPHCFGSCTDSDDSLLEALPGYESDTYYVRLDTSVFPHILMVDGHFFIGGYDTRYARIFLGTLPSDETTCVSRNYDQSGKLTSTQLDLELLALDNVDNKALKNIRPGYTTTRMADGEVVTVVIYNEEGHVVRSKIMRVVNTAVLRNHHAPLKYITDITIDSPFMDVASGVLEIPINLPISGLNLLARVHYSDGFITDPIPVNGSPFTLFGINHFTSLVVGKEIPLALRYAMGETEHSVESTDSVDRFFTKKYSAKVVEATGGYNVKLFAYPQWISAAVGYRLRWSLVSRDTGGVYDVTESINYMSEPVFDGKLYGVTQPFTVAIDVSLVVPGFKAHIHEQHVEVLLGGVFTGNLPIYSVTPVIGGKTVIGSGLTCRLVSGLTGVVNLSGGEPNVDSWLNRYFHAASPVLSFGGEDEILTPTHFTLTTDSGKVIKNEVKYFGYDKVLGVSLKNGDVIRLDFHYETDTWKQSVGSVFLTVN